MVPVELKIFAICLVEIQVLPNKLHILPLYAIVFLFLNQSFEQQQHELYFLYILLAYLFAVQTRLRSADGRRAAMPELIIKVFYQTNKTKCIQKITVKKLYNDFFLY